MFVVQYFGYGYALRNQLWSIPFLRNNFPFLIQYHAFISYMLYIIGFIYFVLKLKKEYYMYQFKQFAWTHMTIFCIIVTLQFVSWNIHRGMIWFVLPVTLINVNDIFAYLSGVFFGRTQLIELSPKKTWEGFIGAAIFTVITGVILAGTLRHYDFMVCPKMRYNLKELVF